MAAFDNQKALEKIDILVSGAFKKARMVMKNAAKTVGEELVDRTPHFFESIPSSGNTKANWKVSLGQPEIGYVENVADYSGSETKSAIRGEIQRMRLPKDTNYSIFLANTSPAIASLEYGLYPNPPMRGSYNPLTKQYEIRSSNGFSLQAPQGIVGVTAIRWPEIVSDAIARHNPLEE